MALYKCLITITTKCAPGGSRGSWTCVIIHQSILSVNSCRWLGFTYLYCIVLYLYIYIALLAVHTNQKCFQCEKPREKRAVLRECGPTVDDSSNLCTYCLLRQCFHHYQHHTLPNISSISCSNSSAPCPIQLKVQNRCKVTDTGFPTTEAVSYQTLT